MLSRHTGIHVKGGQVQIQSSVNISRFTPGRPDQQAESLRTEPGGGLQSACSARQHCFALSFLPASDCLSSPLSTSSKTHLDSQLSRRVHHTSKARNLIETLAVRLPNALGHCFDNQDQTERCNLEIDRSPPANIADSGVMSSTQTRSAGQTEVRLFPVESVDWVISARGCL